MSKIEDYISQLIELNEWEGFLKTESNLPGPRGNLELIYAVAATGEESFFNRLIALDNPAGNGNTPDDFLTMCAVVGLGKLVGEGNRGYLETLRRFASDRRWRIRESVAMALQLFGDRDMDGLIIEMTEWARGNPCEKRAAVAALCEPRLLKDSTRAARVLDILDGITASIEHVSDRKSDGFAVLEKGLGYGWSVAVAACPKKGKALMEKWIAGTDKTIRRIMQENLTKNQLFKMDAVWVTAQQAKLAAAK